MSGDAISPLRAEAQRVGAALVLFVLDGDAESASALLEGSSFPVLAQAATDLARWITYCCSDADPAEFRAQLAAQLERAAIACG